jgi:serine/threonine-protein phosphatase PGAM5
VKHPISCALIALLCLAAQSIPSPAADAAPKPGLRTLYFIRHGMYEKDDPSDDRIGKRLDKLGREQMALIGKRLAALPVRMTSLTSSELTRGRESGDIIGRILHMPPARDSLLNECTPYRNNARAVQDSADADSAEARLERAWARYVRPSLDGDAHDVLVCHGNVIRWMTCKALGVDTKQWATMDIGNGSLTVILVRADGTARLVEYSDVGHIPVKQQTWSGKGGNWAAPANNAKH